MDVTEFFGLSALPFSAHGADPVVTASVRTAAAVLAKHIDSGVPVIGIVGPPGSGKSFLLHSLAADLGLSHARPRFLAGDGGDRVFDKTELLLIDEADRVPADQLRTLALTAAKREKRLVAAMNAPAQLPDAAMVTVGPMTPADALAFLEAHFARGADRFPFDPDAADAIAAAGRTPRQVKALAGAALVEAMVDGAPVVRRHHAARALAEMPRLRSIVTESPPSGPVRTTSPGMATASDVPRTAPPTQRWHTPAAATAFVAALALLIAFWPYTARNPGNASAPRAVTSLPPSAPTPTPKAVSASVFEPGAATSVFPADPSADPSAGPAADTAVGPPDAAPKAAALADAPDRSAKATTAKPASPVAADPRRSIDVVIRYAADAPPVGAESAYALAGLLERGGWRVSAVRPGLASYPAARTLYFNDADKAAASALGREAAATVRRSAGPGRRGTVEIWLPS